MIVALAAKSTLSISVWLWFSLPAASGTLSKDSRRATFIYGTGFLRRLRFDCSTALAWIASFWSNRRAVSRATDTFWSSYWRQFRQSSTALGHILLAPFLAFTLSSAGPGSVGYRCSTARSPHRLLTGGIILASWSRRSHRSCSDGAEACPIHSAGGTRPGCYPNGKPRACTVNGGPGSRSRNARLGARCETMASHDGDGIGRDQRVAIRAFLHHRFGYSQRVYRSDGRHLFEFVVELGLILFW